MILVAVGTQFPFDRMVRTVEQWASQSVARKVVAQIGRTSYAPAHIKAYPFLPPKKFQSLLEQAQLVIAHCGMGSILSALSLGKPIIVMPRSAALGEHRNDHQFATAKRFSDLKGLTIAWDEFELMRALESWDQNIDSAAGHPAIAPKAPAELTAKVRDFLRSVG